ncbi:MAG TPA: efflux transporter outer membrane subunit [Povalibacter sp.]|uniref:efflux transporter outer membrane subunit n=1 Tax=Povalibacter sp. TaxID=1962978 RepID=UPI002C701907|nr:efflux transporter outer membrane subunit [Povalibacter sp.]HMN43169.1 efflux transporter outer membrane subunit [Povalibacter sp.]
MRIAWTLAAAFALGGCVFPQVEDPATAPVATESLGLDGDSIAPADARWWTALGDPQLDALIEEALRGSPTLAQTLARVRSAQAQSDAAGSERQPRFTFDADETYQRFSEHFYIPPPYGGNNYWVGQATANMSWDLDFWGRQSALISQANAQLAASQLDVAAARLALAGAITQTYLDLHRAWEMIDIATRLEIQRQHLLDLTRQRVSAGLDTQMEIKIAEATLPQARNARLQAEGERDVALHRLAELTGHGADRYAQISRPKLTLDAGLSLPDHLPADLLAHRPDVLAARTRVDAATAGREAAHAEFYPNVNLKAFVGTQAIGLDKLVDGGSLIYGAGPALHLPIFDARRLRANYKGATADLDASIAGYNETVLAAIRETSDQISLGDYFTQQIDQAQQTLDAAGAAYDLAQKRYEAGLSTQLVVLDAESRVLDARRDLVILNSNRLLSRVNLLLMLGGSFDPAAPASGDI